MLVEFVILAAIVMQASSPAAPAADGSPTSCRSISDRDTRLACYDRTMAEPVAPPRAIGTAPRSVERKAQRTERARPAVAAALESRIVTASRRADGRWSFRLADGSAWAQLDDRNLNIDPKAGQPIRIRPASMGSFFANVNRQVAIRVRPIG